MWDIDTGNKVYSLDKHSEYVIISLYKYKIFENCIHILFR